MTEDAHAILQAFAGRRLLCVGDVMLDVFVHGSVERVSPEAPIAVLRVAGRRHMPGGAGNVVRNAAALGAEARLIGVVGEDQAGRDLAALFGAEPTMSAELLPSPDRPTIVKTRYLAGAQQLLRADEERAGPLPEGVAARLAERAVAAVDACDALVLSDYGKGTLGEAAIGALIAAARRRGVPVVVDPKRRDLAAYAGATLLKPNRAELAEASGLACHDDDELVAAARRVLREADVGAVLVSRSERGATLVGPGEAVHHFPAAAREVFDVSGAGDTMIATLAVALAAGADPAAAAHLANLAGGLVVAKAGTATVRRDELAAALREEVLDSSEAKIADREAAQERVAAWRRRGLRIGFTNGCFDLLHPGHVSLLRQARARCDRLVVGLNSDASVRRLKGDGRPVQGEEARAVVLASLGDVDLVTLFGEDTPLALLEALRPDLLVKGADYRLDQVVGAELVRGWGGEVLLVELVEGHSTTGAIARMKRRATDAA